MFTKMVIATLTQAAMASHVLANFFSVGRNLKDSLALRVNADGLVSRLSQAKPISERQH